MTAIRRVAGATSPKGRSGATPSIGIVTLEIYGDMQATGLPDQPSPVAANAMAPVDAGDATELTF